MFMIGRNLLRWRNEIGVRACFVSCVCRCWAGCVVGSVFGDGHAARGWAINCGHAGFYVPSPAATILEHEEMIFELTNAGAFLLPSRL